MIDEDSVFLGLGILIVIAFGVTFIRNYRRFGK